MVEQIDINKQENNSSNKAEQKAENPSASISKIAEDIKNRLAEAKKQKEENIAKQLGERESLIAEQKNNDELFVQAKEALDYFDSLDQASLELLDDQGKAQLQQLRETMTTLEEQRQRINERISVISDNPEVFNKMHEQAMAEDKKVEDKKDFDKGVEEINNQADILNKAISALDKKITEEKEIWKKRDELYSKILSLFNEAERMSKSISGDLNSKKYSFPEGTDVISPLNELRKGLGIFATKDKAAIDHILKDQNMLNDFAKAMVKHEELDKEVRDDKKLLSDSYKNIRKEASDLRRKYQSDTDLSWEIYRKVSDYCDKNNLNYLHPNYLS